MGTLHASTSTIKSKNTLDTLDFSTNWNNKLHCNCFTTIRPTNPGRYRPGRIMEVRLRGDLVKKVLIMAVMQLGDIINITEHLACLDTGYDREETIRIVRTMYKNKQEVFEKGFSIILLQTVKEK